jgi:hypothetical protein
MQLLQCNHVGSFASQIQRESLKEKWSTLIDKEKIPFEKRNGITWPSKAL